MLMSKVKVKEVFAYYLPQFHQVNENDKWWGVGFTEWTLIKRAKKQFGSHELFFPGELGYYDLSDARVIEMQYALAKSHSVTSFCFWHYWFNDDDKLLHKPAELLLKSNCNVKFCFAWANHDWWNKKDKVFLKKQHYDFSVKKHFEYLLPFFKDSRYTKIDGMPVFVVFKPSDIPSLKSKIDEYQTLAREHGFPGVFFMAEHSTVADENSECFHYVINSRSMLSARSNIRKYFDKLISFFSKFNIYIPRVYSYKEMTSGLLSSVSKNNRELPVVIPRWDSTIRHGRGGYVLHGSNPEAFGHHVAAVADVLSKRDINDRYLFIKSWNEWGEGNFIEPCNKHERKYLEVFAQYFEADSE